MSKLTPYRTYSFLYSGINPAGMLGLILSNSFANQEIKTQLCKLLYELSNGRKKEEIAFIWLERDFIIYDQSAAKEEIVTNIKVKINRLGEAIAELNLPHSTTQVEEG